MKKHKWLGPLKGDIHLVEELTDVLRILDDVNKGGSSYGNYACAIVNYLELKGLLK